MLKKLMQLVLIAGGLMSLPACSTTTSFVTWKEEVKLNDGRVIVVNQKKRCQVGAYTGGDIADCIAREAWLTINLPELSAQEIVWHEKLSPMILNLDKGNLYVVGIPPTGAEFIIYGKPQPPYVGFVFESGQWKRIPFNEIPVSIYDSNMLLEGIPPKGTEFLTLTKKNSREVNGDPRTGKMFKRIDPTFRSN